MLLTPASHIPPKCGDRLGENFQSRDREAEKWRIASLVCLLLSMEQISDNSFLASTKFVPMSDSIVFGFPRLATKRVRVARKASVVRSDTSSMWIAFVEKHKNTDINLD